jgi:ethanolamine utilization cobalamin adenosyltransferase
VREVELEACSTFIDDTYKLTREDIIQGLNRLSSAFYVLMLMTLVSESGITVSLEKVASL